MRAALTVRASAGRRLLKMLKNGRQCHSDQEPLSTQEFAQAVNCCQTIQKLVETRQGWIEAAGKDKSIHLPQANWDLSKSVLHSSYRTVVGGTYPVLNHLRLFSHNFTGFMLSKLKKGPNPALRAVPEDLDEQIGKLAGTDCPWEEWHETISRALPREYRIGPPRKFGEIGWQIDGTIVNYDSCVYLERIALLAAGKVVQRLAKSSSRPRILDNEPDSSPGGQARTWTSCGAIRSSSGA